MAGATSLVELILKKWGDDAAKVAVPAAGIMAAGQSEDADAGFVTRGGKTLLEAWHGSPHKFDKFSMDQIGTGEGAQAYGHGLYFADSEDVARGYQETLSNRVDGGFPARRITLDGIEIDPKDEELHALAEHVKILGKDEAREVWGSDPLWQKIENAEIGQIYDKGALYRTEIDVTPESLLDWDKPLSADTPQQMKDAINTLVKNNPDLKDDLYQAYREDQPGSIYYSLLSDHAKTGDIVKNQQFATQQLNDAGIKGIKYLDGNSRNSVTSWADGADSSAYDPLAKGIAENYLESANNNVEKAVSKLRDDAKASGARQYADAATALEKGHLHPSGTSNYVIFDDSLINIAERGNATVPMLATTAGLSGAGLLASQIKDSGMISAPRSENLFNLTMGARDLERRLEGSPASLLFPSGLVEYLETVNRREEDPNAMTRGMALLDVLPW